MELKEVMDYLESKGSDQTRKVYANHGAPEGSFFGVKVADLKPIERKEKNNQRLAKELYKTGNSDAQYLAGLIADAKEFSKEELTEWAKNATWYMVAEYSVAWNLAESPFCMELCMNWIDGKDESLKQVAWAGLSSYVSLAPNEVLNVDLHRSLVDRIVSEIHEVSNRVRYCMNGYIIALGGAVPELTEYCKKAGDRIGKVQVNMGKTACKVPEIRPYIEKMEAKNRIGKKRKTAKC